MAERIITSSGLTKFGKELRERGLSETVRLTSQTPMPQNVEIQNNTIYHISNVTTLTITTPSTERYMAHLYVSFAESGTPQINLPENLRAYGTDTATVGNGNEWEISIDSEGGILCLRKT